MNNLDSVGEKFSLPKQPKISRVRCQRHGGNSCAFLATTQENINSAVLLRLRLWRGDLVVCFPLLNLHQNVST